MSEPGISGPLAAIVVGPSTSLRDVLAAHDRATSAGLPAGIALVVDGDDRLVGTVTDGDVRRCLLDHGSLDAPAEAAMRPDPILFREGQSYREILHALPVELARRGRRSNRFLGKIVLVDDERRPTRVLDYHHLWEQRVATHRHVVVLGLGYVGLTLALVLAEEGFLVTGVDLDHDKVEALNRGVSHVHEVGLAELLREQLDENLRLHTELPDDGDVYVVAVGTPLRVAPDGRQAPDLAYLDGAVEMVGRALRPGALVVLRSTVPIGTTRELVLPRLEAVSGLRGGSDFHLAFAPERTAEGSALAELRTLPQLIGGINDDSVEATVALFRELTPTIVRMESTEAAELAKLVNNSFRDLSFAFANEVAQMATPYGFDVIEALRSANRAYPRNPVPLPSPGVGGPCLTKDPYILAHSSPNGGGRATLSELGRHINEAMPEFAADQVVKALEGVGKSPAACSVLVCGIAFKGEPETGDWRSSTALDVAAALEARVGRLLGHDPVVPASEISQAGFVPVELFEGAGQADAVLFLTNHREYQHLDVSSLVRALRPAGVVYDGWGLFRAEEVVRAAPCVYIGHGHSRSSAAGA